MSFAYYSSVDIKLLKTNFKIGLPLAKNVITPLAKSVLMPLTLATAAFLVQGQHY